MILIDIFFKKVLNILTIKSQKLNLVKIKETSFIKLHVSIDINLHKTSVFYIKDAKFIKYKITTIILLSSFDINLYYR